MADNFILALDLPPQVYTEAEVTQIQSVKTAVIVIVASNVILIIIL